MRTAKLVDPKVPIPSDYDPIGDVSDESAYHATQELAAELSLQRARQVMAKRGMSVSSSQIRRIDVGLWSGWKGSSTSEQGKLLQVAIAEELGGRLREEQIGNLNSKAYADSHYAGAGGYEGIKAYMRAKWETTQHLLDKAKLPVLKLYRAISMPVGPQEVTAVKFDAKSGTETTFQHLPHVKLERNGAASMTASRDVANGWGGQSTRRSCSRTSPRPIR